MIWIDSLLKDIKGNFQMYNNNNYYTITIRLYIYTFTYLIQ